MAQLRLNDYYREPRNLEHFRVKIVKLENELYCEQERTDRHFIANTHTHTHTSRTCVMVMVVMVHEVERSRQLDNLANKSQI